MELKRGVSRRDFDNKIRINNKKSLHSLQYAPGAANRWHILQTKGVKESWARDNEALVGLGRFGPPPSLYSSIIPFVDAISKN